MPFESHPYVALGFGRADKRNGHCGDGASLFSTTQRLAQ